MSLDILSVEKQNVVEELEAWLQEVDPKYSFILRHRFYKGQTVIRGMPVSHYDILIGTSPLTEIYDMTENPLDKPDSRLSARRKTQEDPTPKGEPPQNWLSFEGAIPPKDAKLSEVELVKEIADGVYRYKQDGQLKTSNETFPSYYDFKKDEQVYVGPGGHLYNCKRSTYNPTKTLPVYLLIGDSGKVNLLEDSSQFMSMKFAGKKLKGYYTLVREDPSSPIWTFGKSSLPGQKLKKERG